MPWNGNSSFRGKLDLLKFVIVGIIFPRNRIKTVCSHALLNFFKTSSNDHYPGSRYYSIYNFLVLFNTIYYQKEYKYQKVRGFKLEFNSSFTQSLYFKVMLVTNFLNIIHTPPYFEYQFKMVTLDYPIRYSLSVILSNLIFLRLYLLVRVFTTYSRWKT